MRRKFKATTIKYDEHRPNKGGRSHDEMEHFVDDGVAMISVIIVLFYQRVWLSLCRFVHYESV